jgi:hypothetical protein
MSDLDDVVLAVCRMPLDQERSHVDAMERSGYLDHRGAISVEHLYACLTQNLDLVDAWQGWSDDNRASPARYLRSIGTGPFEVGLIQGGRTTERLTFDDRARACAEYILREVESIVAVHRSWQRGCAVVAIAVVLIVAIAIAITLRG